MTEKLYKRYTTAEVARMLGVTMRRIQYAAKRLDIWKDSHGCYQFTKGQVLLIRSHKAKDSKNWASRSTERPYVRNRKPEIR